MDGETLGKYEIRSTLGRGAMGTVYEAWDPVISRRVAVKTVRLPDAEDVDAQEELARFKREAQAAGRLHHPNIVGVFDYGESSKIAYIVMEFVDGRTLKAVLDAEERPTLAAITGFMEDLLRGLSYSHERGVIHRDIKPANLIISRDGPAKIADFGIARIESSNMTQAGTIMGTPAYMSPEQFMGQTVDERTDIYSSGVLLFQLLTGDRPFEGSMATIMHKALNTVPPKPSDLSVTAPMSLDAVVARAMARRPEERYPSAAAFLEAFQAALRQPAGLGIGLGPDLDAGDATIVAAPAKAAARPASVSPPAPRPSRLPLAAGAAALVLAAGGGAAWWTLRPSQPTTPVVVPDTPARQPTPPGNTTVATQPPLPAPDTTQPTPPAPERPVVAEHPAPDPVSSRPPSPTVPVEPPQPVPPVVTTEAVPPPPPDPVPQRQPVIVGPTIIMPYRPPNPAADAGTPSVPDPAVPAVDTPVPPTRLAAPALTPEALRRAVAAAVGGADCAIVSGDVARPGGAVELRGVVGAGGPEAELRQAVQDATGAAAVDWGMGVANGPYCPVLNLVRPLVRPFGTAGGPVLGMADNRTSLTQGDLVRAYVVMPDRAHLQIDYFSGDGTVLHMHQAVPSARGPFPAGSVQRAGEPRGTFQGWQALPPFGTDMVAAVTSSTPLFPQERPQGEQADDYLRDLRTALDQARRGGARLGASVVLVRTAPKP